MQQARNSSSELNLLGIGGAWKTPPTDETFDALIVERRVGALTLDMLVASAQKKGPGPLKHGAL
jgi:hypothetical protein